MLIFQAANKGSGKEDSESILPCFAPLIAAVFFVFKGRLIEK
jgi:hypothetical protein